MSQVSREQIDRAKSIDLLTYLQAHEPHSILQQGPNRHVLCEHDSFVLSNGKWHWWSRGIGGFSALDFLVKVRGYDFIAAIQSLTEGVTSLSYQSKPLPPKPTTPPKPPKPFTLPTANANNDRLIAYLRGRGIDKDILNRCIEAGSLYENTKSNCVFVGFDGNTARFAAERGIVDDYKKDVFGSNKKFGFTLPPKNPNSRNIALMEAPVDVLGHATIHKMDGDKWDGHRLSLGGISSLALMAFLEQNLHIESILFCLDNDKSGKDASNRMIKELLSDKKFSHMKITIAPPPLGKDYCDTLQAIHQLNKEKIHSNRQNKAVHFI